MNVKKFSKERAVNPCKKCGSSDNLAYREDLSYRDKLPTSEWSKGVPEWYRIECLGCGSNGPKAKTKEKACKGWNKITLEI